MNLQNKQPKKVALITGAARRIGAAIAKLLHLQGFDLVVHCYRSVDEANTLANVLNQERADSVFVLKQDLRDLQKGDELIKEAVFFKKRLDLLVNNASLFQRSDFTTLDSLNWNMLFKLNVEVPFLLSQAAFPYLKQQSGCIVNLTDIHAENPLKDYSVYCQTKAALTMQTKSLAREFAPHVRVNAVAPGAIMWPEENNALSSSQKQSIIERTPLKQHGDPKWIAQAVLALTENAFITGQTLRVDGGRSLS